MKSQNSSAIPVHVVERSAASVALMKLHKVVHGRVSDQGILVHEVLAADLARELHVSMVPFRVPLHVDGVHTHEVALSTGHRLRCVRFFHVGIQHELLRIRLSASDALERPVDTVNDPQVCHQSGHEVKLLLTEIADLFVPLESANSEILLCQRLSFVLYFEIGSDLLILA